ncbi:efflux RND transporter periplasmic adaptor subunit [Marinobacter daepoensis]|uniref:Efflux RND transporter periplasmic adaptor subunit n=1 Tax=Marinobacter daepoensis TaxID=262077 RepID=A0ABS3BG78_9GAMM|nr:efflux RND transporter periplasmic adaptor subunit [Marinobacter daepoensis]MBN7769722.1 efflux RND transporter periplasmic adaptor subunit [Marinobacter daepoensis]MBY6078412.1 efflux RND transporter periplasmic adaptor subunit [Marinobacter daepoensis]
MKTNRRNNASNRSGMTFSPRRLGLPIALLCASLLSGCAEEKSVAPPAVPVHVMTLAPQDIELFERFTGQVSSQQEVQLRARVSGVLLEKHFEDGAYVKQGDLLFTIDDRDLKARVLEAEASLDAARSDYERARLDVERYEPLLETQAIARQVYDNAYATMSAARSRIENGKALVEQARLAVEYASIVSPVSGRIGAAEVDIGDLITAGSSLLAEVSTTDMSRVEFSVSEPKLIEYERRHGNIDNGARDKQVPVSLYLSDGTLYGHPGVINFSDRALNPSTGTIRMRADFPNPEGTLRPGMFARIELVTETRENVLAVPDKAVEQLLNSYRVTTVDEEDIARKVEVAIGPRQQGLWIIEDGLNAGDRIVVEGIQKARDGVLVDVLDQSAADSGKQQ